jgi:hypothetical protein
MFNKYVGVGGEGQWLFEGAQKDQRNRKNWECAQLHLMIFDELDSICKKRGSATGADSGLNHLLWMYNS